MSGYEIRHGTSQPTAPIEEALPDGLGWVDGSVLGLYLHGLLEQPEFLEALFGQAPTRSLDYALDELAEALEQHLDLTRLLAQLI